MPRYSDIRHCFNISITLDPKGQKLLRTSDFVAELARHNWIWTFERANAWIENQISYFIDITLDFSENRTFKLNSRNGPY